MEAKFTPKMASPLLMCRCHPGARIANLFYVQWPIQSHLFPMHWSRRTAALKWLHFTQMVSTFKLQKNLKNIFYLFLDGLRISKSTRIQHLLTFQEFYLRINDSFYKFDQDPAFVGIGSQDKVKTFGDVQSKVSENLIIF